MAKLFNKLTIQDGFSDTEQVIANYILTYPKDIISESIDNIARKTYTSPATVVRFSKKLGYSGFTDLKIKVASEINLFTTVEKYVEADIPILPESTTETIVNTFYNLSTRSLKEVSEMIDPTSIDEVASLIHNAASITLLGVGPSHLVAMDLHYKLRRLGYNSVCESNIGFDVQYGKRAPGNHVALVVSSFANSPQTRDWIRRLNELGRKTVLITTNKDSSLLKLVDCSIVADLSENQVLKVGAFSSRISLTYVLDCIYGVLFNMDYSSNIDILYDISDRLGPKDKIDFDLLKLIDKNL